jgi:hypothetical protein
MSGNGPTSGENNNGGAQRGEHAQQIWVLAQQHLPQASPISERRGAKARVSSKNRPGYFDFVDWREHPLDECGGRESIFTVRDQEGTDACAGFAVAHALRANIAIHRRVDIGEVNAHLIWGLAREQDPRLRDGRSGYLRDALLVVNNYGIPSNQKVTARAARRGGLTARIRELALEFEGERGILKASVRKIQGVVDLGYFLGDYAAWLHAFGPIAVHMMVNPDTFQAVGPQRPLIEYVPGQVFDGEVTTRYSGHDVVVVGFVPYQRGNELSDSFIVMNSYGKKWGRAGFAYIKFETAQVCFRAGYGLLLREHLGFRFGGAIGAATTPLNVATAAASARK